MSGINVSSVDFQIMTKQRKLELSHGEVTKEGAPKFEANDKTKLLFPQDGLFSETIFGYSRDSTKGAIAAKFTDSLPPRMKRFGHINLKVPHVLPYLYGTNSSKINILLGISGPKLFKEIIDWERAVIRVVNGTPQCDFMEGLVRLKDSKGVTKLKIDSAYKKKLVIKKLDETNKDKIDTEKILYYTVPPKYLEKAVKYGDNPRYKSLDYWNNPESNSAVFMGSYAVLHFLSFMDYGEEIIYTSKRLNELKEGIELAESDNAKVNIIKKFKVASERYQMLINFKKRELPLDSLVSDVLLVTPAGLRDVSLRTDPNGVPTIKKATINDKYKEILSANKDIDKYGTFLTPEEIINTKNNVEWTRTIPTKPEFIDKAKRIQMEINEITLKEISAKVGKKEGRFRQTVLSRRIDQTGRGVITPDPELEIDEMGVPLYILDKLLTKGIIDSGKKPTINLTKESLIKFLRGNSKKYLTPIEVDMGIESSRDGSVTVNFVPISNSEEDKINTVIEFEKILAHMRQLSIRFPSLHKYNLLGFKIKVVYDHTIHLHPLVCAPYNADFDGDQMSLYLVQTPNAVNEVDDILMPSKNLLNTNGSPLITPSQDAVLGSYYMTLVDHKTDGKIPVFHDFNSMFRAYELGRIKLHQKVTVLTPHYSQSDYKGKYVEYVNHKRAMNSNFLRRGEYFSNLMIEETPFLVYAVPTYKNENRQTLPKQYVTSTVGRFIFNQAIPQDIGFVDRNRDAYSLEIDAVISKKGNAGLSSGDIKSIILRTIETKPLQEVIFVLDTMKELGYEYATLSGMSMSIQDIYTHPDKPRILEESFQAVEEINKDEKEGKISKAEASAKRISVWQNANEDLTKKTMDFLPDDNPIKMMSVSGSRGNRTQIAQLMGMRGLMADTSANIIETPVTSSFLDGLSMVEYFTASYGTRKGIFDRSNRTKETGETTRTSVYGTEKLVVVDGDCGDTEGILMKPLYDNSGNVIKKVTERIKGKFILEDLVDSEGKVVLPKGQCVMKDYTYLEDLYKDKTIKVRSPITCKHRLGLCSKCYGYNYGSNRFAKLGDAVGVIASQTIGEPGTQLTMRTFHTGGVAKDDITQGFTMVRSLLESRKYPPSLEQLLAKSRNIPSHDLKDIVNKVIVNLEKYIDTNIDNVMEKTGMTFTDYGIANADLYVTIMIGAKELLQVAYQTQGIDLLDTHYEVIARAMATLLEVEYQGDSIYPMGQLVNWSVVESTNVELVKRGLNPMIVKPTLNPLKTIALSNQSPFTAMTYQSLNRVLSSALTVQGEDDLTNPMSSTMVSNVLASGEGARMYIGKSRKRYENVLSNRQLMEALEVPMYDESNLQENQAEIIEDVETTPSAATELDWDMVDNIIQQHETGEDEVDEYKEEEPSQIEQPNEDKKDIDLTWGM